MKPVNRLDEFSNAYTNDFAYSLDNKLMLEWYPKRILTKLKQGSILELGLGHGLSTKVFSEFADSYTVIDGSEKIIKQFCDFYPAFSNVKIVQSLFEEYQTREKFDNIILGFVLEHVEDPQHVIKRFKGFLADKGKMFITVPNATSLHRQIGLHAQLTQNLYELSSADLELGHKRIFDINSLELLISQCELEILSIEGIFLKPFTTAQLQKLSLPKEVLAAMMELGINYPELSNALLIECRL